LANATKTLTPPANTRPYINVILAVSNYLQDKSECLPMSFFSRLLSNIIPKTQLNPHDETVIMSMEDVYRRRLIMVAIFGLCATILHASMLFFTDRTQSEAEIGLITAGLELTICSIAILVGFWGRNPTPVIRLSLLVYAALLWFEIIMTGGVMSYQAVFLTLLPVVAALLVTPRDTIMFTAFNIAILLGVAGLTAFTNHIPMTEGILLTTLATTAISLSLAVCACASGAIIMAAQNGKIQSQLREVVDYQSHLAAHDHLSGLGNRISLQERFEGRTPDNPDDRFDLLLIDLDGFKAVNDTYGHNAGDYLIKALSQRLREVTNESDLLIRLGGDEFVILLEDMNCPTAQVRKYAEYLIGVVSRPYKWEGKVLKVSASIGHARYPLHAKTTTKTLSLADGALYVAKAAGKAQCVTHGIAPRAMSTPQRLKA
jgi:diguanylate cyclase (GGDEF)-like protein